jgi:hypothetical protein
MVTSFSGRLGRRRSERHRERASAAWRRDQVGGKRGQRVDGARGQRRVHSLVELGPVEAAVGDGGAQQLDDPVAVRVGRAQHGRAGRICRHAASPAT